MSEKRLPPQSMDMELARPKESVCKTCKFRKPDDVIERKDGSKAVIEQWRNAKCEKYDQKPVEVLFDNQLCGLYEHD